jgi:hypothetical protein
MYRAEIKLQRMSVSIVSSAESVTVFKSLGSMCDFEVFDTSRESDIVEYVIAPLPGTYWQFVEDPPTDSAPNS